MQKLLLVVIYFFLFGLQVKAHKFFTRTGSISFHASTPMENIDAATREAASIIDVDKKDVVFHVPVKSFSFKKALMQEHFNENYMESSKFPMAAFKGKIRDDGRHPFRIQYLESIYSEKTEKMS